MMETVILAGGQGLRLKGQTDIPKPFLIIDPETGQTLLDYQLRWCVENGFEHIILTLSRENYKFLRKNYAKLLNVPAIDVSIEEEPRKSGGALKLAFDYIEENNFYCFNIDDIVSYNPQELFRAQNGRNAILVKTATLPFGVVEFDREMHVTSFIEKPVIDQFVSTGHYVFAKEQIEDLLEDGTDLEQTTLRTLASNQCLYAYNLKGSWITINTLKDLLEAQKKIKVK